MGSERSWIGRAHLTRWMQALGLVYVLMFLPVRGYGGADAGAVDAGSIQTDAEGMADGGEAAEQQEPMIALTFDDGPDSVCTPMLLDGLKARGVKATFFLIGENIVKDGNQKIVKRMEEEGHLIGNHTYHHVDLSRLSREEAHQELALTDNLIREITGHETQIVRPPFGAFPDRMEEEIDKLYVKWTVDPLDWMTQNSDEIVRRVVTETEENDIILLHDCYESSVKAALRIIDVLRGKGYEFVTADRLLLE